MASTVSQLDSTLRDPTSRATVACSARPSANVIPFPPVAISLPEQAMLGLDGDGMIRDCSVGAERLFDSRRDDLLGCHASTLFPILADTALTHGGPIYPRLAFLNRDRAPFRAFRHNGEELFCQLFLGNPGDALLVIVARRVVNRCAEAH